MGQSQSKQIRHLPDGTVELSFIDNNAKQKQYKKYIVTYKYPNTHIEIKRTSTESKPFISCSNLIHIHRGFAFGTIYRSDISAFGPHESDENKLILMNFIKEYGKDVENTDYVTNEDIYYENMILSSDGGYYEIIYNPIQNKIRIRCGSDQLEAGTDEVQAFSEYPHDVLNEVALLINTF
jgi:hypothetical protein